MTRNKRASLIQDVVMNRSNVINFPVYHEHHKVQKRSNRQKPSAISDDLKTAIQDLIKRLRDGNPIKVS